MNKFFKSLQSDIDIKEKRLENNISSFNFTRKAFQESRWNSRTITSRGLFCDNVTGEVIARSFNKFFAVNERPETQLGALKNTLSFPLFVYKKENGFLGICSYHKDFPNNLFLASKSTNQGEYADYFKNIFNNIMPNNLQIEFANFLKSMNCSAVFEVIDPEHDPHIVEYNQQDIVLLALIENNFEYHQMPYWLVRATARIFKINCKIAVEVIKDWNSFITFYERSKQEKECEGYVIEDSKGYQLKIKNDWYKYWKRMRSVLRALSIGKKPKDICQKYRLKDSDMELFNFMNDYIDKNEDKNISIIDVRNAFEKEQS